MKNSTIIKSLCLLVVALVYGQVAKAQTIHAEDFNGGIPATWTIFDVDGQAVHANVAQFTSAWIGADDFTNPGDTVAMSTSWYATPGTSDDWLISPAIALTSNNVLSWDAMAQDAAYPDGYEVRISTTAPTTAGCLANPALFTIAAEANAWTSQSVDLQAAGYANQTVYIAFRNTSTDMFIIKINNFLVQAQVAFDAAISSTTGPDEYTIFPISQVTALGTDAMIDNVGSSAVTNAVMTTTVFDGTMTSVYSGASTPIASIAAGNSAAANVAGYVPTVSDFYTVQQVVSITEADGDANNDTIFSYILVDDSIFARDDATLAGGLGAGTGGGLTELGQTYVMSTPDTITSISGFIYNFNGDLAGQSISGTVYDISGGTIGTVLGQTDTIVMDTTQNMMYTWMMSGGPVFLAGIDSFAIALTEGDSNMGLGYTNAIVTPNTTWVTLDGGATWNPNEFYGFPNTYVLRANFGRAYTPPVGCTLSITGISGVDVLCNGGADGSATVVATGASGTESYSWTGGGSSATVTGLTAGSYTVTVTDTMGCLVDTTITITEPAPIQLSVTGTDPTCNGGTDGSATVVAVSGNQGSAQAWSWTSGGTAATETGLGAGTYDVTLTDSAGCSATGSVTITEPSAIQGNESGTDATSLGAADGTATVAPAGGTAPYTYSWAPGGETTASISGLVAGSYVCTITDANGCTSTVTVVVADGPDGVYDNRAGVELVAFPNPVNDNLTLNINLAINDDLKIEVVNSLGQTIYTHAVSGTSALNHEINTEKWATGVYHVVVSTSTGQVSHKITK